LLIYFNHIISSIHFTNTRSLLFVSCAVLASLLLAGAFPIGTSNNNIDLATRQSLQSRSSASRSVNQLVVSPDTDLSSPSNGPDSHRSQINRRALSDLTQMHKTTAFDEKNGWAATYYLHVIPIPGETGQQLEMVWAQAVPHSTPVTPGSYGLKFGNSHAPGDSGKIYPLGQRRALSDWTQIHKTTAFNADYGSSTSEKNGWAATHYVHVTPIPGETNDVGQQMVWAQAVPHSTPVAPGSYGLKFGNNRTPGDSGVIHPSG